jgi:CelD/BcsL family acetyltransferase involved in cellulose biosynthesis
MNLAVRPPLTLVRTPALARVAVFSSFGEAEPYWRSLVRSGAVMTAYQRVDFLQLWQEHLGQDEGVAPRIVVGFDTDDEPLVVLPLGVRQRAGLRIAQFLGGKHVNFNFGVWRRDFIGAADRAAVARLFNALQGHADALALTNQPECWQGYANPLASWPHQDSPSMGHSAALISDFDALMRERVSSSARRKSRKKAEGLAATGPVDFWRADTAAKAREVLAAFFAQKVARMRMIGQPDVFDDPAIHRFLESAVTDSEDATPPVEIYALTVAGEIIATFGGITDGERFSGMFHSIAPGRFERESPGEQALIHLVRSCCERGLKTLDLGVGEARYKNLFCDTEEALFDTFTGLSAKGRAYMAGARLAAAAKRAVKRNPALLSAAGRLRRVINKISG